DPLERAGEVSWSANPHASATSAVEACASSISRAPRDPQVEPAVRRTSVFWNRIVIGSNVASITPPGGGAMKCTVLLSPIGTRIFCFVFLGIGLFAPMARAVPAFARKTGFACSSCHEVWPRLNDFGQLFRDRGYRLERDRDAPVEQDSSYWPIALRTTV